MQHAIRPEQQGSEYSYSMCAFYRIASNISATPLIDDDEAQKGGETGRMQQQKRHQTSTFYLSSWHWRSAADWIVSGVITQTVRNKRQDPMSTRPMKILMKLPVCVMTLWGWFSMLAHVCVCVHVTWLTKTFKVTEKTQRRRSTQDSDRQFGHVGWAQI